MFLLSRPNEAPRIHHPARRHGGVAHRGARAAAAWDLCGQRFVLKLYHRLPRDIPMRKGTSAGAVICATMLGVAIAQAQSTMTCVQATPAQIAALFDRWNESLATHDPDKVVANYAADAVLLPTLSNVPRTDSAGMKEYFIHFVERDPRAVIDTRTIRIGCNSASDVGTYTFRLTGKTPGTTETVKARYSFVYEWRDGRWLIVHHHSSIMPEPVQ